MGFFIFADMVKTLAAFSAACDLVDATVLNHSERVAYLAMNIGRACDLDSSEIKQLALSALVHDVGVASTKEKLELADLEVEPGIAATHCQRGFKLLSQTTLLAHLAGDVLHHHDYYHEGLSLIPAILHLADRIEILLERDKYCLWQVDNITDYVKAERGTTFHPQAVDAFLEIAHIPSLWLDLESGSYRSIIQNNQEITQELTLPNLEEIARLFSIIVDSQSPFTATHSSGLAEMVTAICQQIGMATEKVRLMNVAALLHDIGKLAVPEEILLHPGKLTKAQYAVMKQHTYYTYHLIGLIGQGVEKLQGWAAYHHERLDGSGYPFALCAEQLDFESRLMAAADVAQAITEDRPYRSGLPKSTVEKILRDQAEQGLLDRDAVDLVLEFLKQSVF